MTKLDDMWLKDDKWLDFDEDTMSFKPKEDAPKEIKESYARYLEQVAEAEKRGALSA